ncbi:hypothetical protein M8818_003283 [Zalaria obscura]|uniref:Uncharacterized protein n=1 Tax=Zalaria obscura TaxID=2024903 RepID=A0ACC3SF65_9PEZI
MPHNLVPGRWESWAEPGPQTESKAATARSRDIALLSVPEVWLCGRGARSPCLGPRVVREVYSLVGCPLGELGVRSRLQLSRSERVSTVALIFEPLVPFRTVELLGVSNMFSSSKRHRDSFSTTRVSKSFNKKQRSFKDHNVSRGVEKAHLNVHNSPPTSPVGPTRRLFAAHEDVLCHSPFFQHLCRQQYFEPSSKRIDLPDEEPEVFSSVLEYLYKGDYYPKLEYNKKQGTWHLEDIDGKGTQANESTVFHNQIGGSVLKDTAIYCTAEKFSLPELKRLALKKQGLQSGIQCTTILSSARYAYAHTPDSDSRLRAHYLALLIRSRNVFKRSGTMQLEMERGGKMFFDLFVALCNHMDDVAGVKTPR